MVGIAGYRPARSASTGISAGLAGGHLALEQNARRALVRDDAPWRKVVAVDDVFFRSDQRNKLDVPLAHPVIAIGEEIFPRGDLQIAQRLTPLICSKAKLSR